MSDDPTPDAYTAGYRAGYVAGYSQGTDDGRFQGYRDAKFRAFSALRNDTEASSELEKTLGEE